MHWGILVKSIGIVLSISIIIFRKNMIERMGVRISWLKVEVKFSV